MAEEMETLEVRETPHGRGVFAVHDFKKGERICEFKGEYFTYAEAPDGIEEDHFLQIDEDLYFGPSGGVDDLFNHSCDPNSGVVINGKEVLLIAIRDVSKGEEIVWDYSTTMDEDDWTMECHCGSPRCRHIIRDFKYLPENIQKEYLTLGIVPEFIAKRFRASV